MYEAYGDQLFKGGNLKEAHVMYNSALERYGELLVTFDEKEQSCWMRKIAVWRIMLKKGLFKEIVGQVMRMRARHPDLGGAGTKEQIENILKQSLEKAK